VITPPQRGQDVLDGTMVAPQRAHTLGMFAGVVTAAKDAGPRLLWLPVTELRPQWVTPLQLRTISLGAP
jgi:hypothetical protein